MTLGDRVAIFSEGSLQQYDAPQALYRRPANIFVAGFIGSPSMNFVEAEFVESGAGTAVSVGGTELALALQVAGGGARSGGRVLLGFRPEHLGWRRSEEGAPGNLQARVKLIEHIEPEAYVSALPVRSNHRRAHGRTNWSAETPRTRPGLRARTPAF